MGEYYNSFFSLSIGLERLAKLIYCFDQEQSTGQFPSQQKLKELGHRVGHLINVSEEIAANHNVKESFEERNRDISKAIVNHIDAFADAKRGRYANFNLMAGSSDIDQDPIYSWMKNVAEPILIVHYRGTQQEKNDQTRAKVFNALLGGHVSVLHHSEDGSVSDTFEKASSRTSENEVLQKYARFYVFCVIRHLADIFRELTHTRGYEDGGELWFGHYEHFNTFTVPDTAGLTRKRWPISGL